MGERQRSPNILIILADQLRHDHVGFGGNRIVRTPNLNRLAARSRVFRNAFVANPICMPNRCSMLTGRVPTAHGVVFNDRSLNWGANTFVRSLAAAGYDTGLIGKAHIQHGVSKESALPLAGAPAVADPYPDGWDHLEHHATYLDNAAPVRDFYGFNHAEFCLGHGDQVTGHHYRWALDKGAKPQDLLQEEPNPSWPVAERSAHWWQVYKPTIAEELYSTTFVAERSIAWLQDRTSETPWFLQCSFPDPHHPFTPPGKWWDAYKANDMPVPDTFADPLTSQPKHLSLIRRLESRGTYVQMFGPSSAAVQHAMAAEFGMIEMIDSAVGRVLAQLEAQGDLDNTLVIFSSDHGDMFGDHGIMLKGMLHYQECLRVPLCIAGPNITPGASDSLACSMDFAQTLLELTQQPAFDRMQGTSLLPILQDPNAQVRDHVYIEEDLPPTEAGGRIPHKARTLVTAQGRFTRYSSGETEAYDFGADPTELRNLAQTDPGSSFTIEMNDRLANALLRYSDLARVNPS